MKVKNSNGYKFTIPEEVFLKLEAIPEEVITVPDATRIIQQCVPTYTDTNLYNAGRMLDRTGQPFLRLIYYTPKLGLPRVLIPRSEFERWIKNPKLGLTSKARRIKS